MSSPSGGFYKYHCKYFMSHDCKNWVWVINTPCSTCLAIGRDEDNAHVSPWGFSTEMYVPQVRNGILQYILMEVLLPSDHSGEAALLRAKATRPPPPVPVTSMMPKTNYIMSNSF